MVIRLFIGALLLVAVAAHAQKVQFEGLKQLNGTKLYVKVLGEGEPLLIIHGGPGLNQSYLTPHLDALAKKYKLIFYDQRASGKSATPAADSVTLTFFANDIEALRKELGADKLNILSHSWGAVPAVKYALLYPQNVKSLIFSNPVPLSKEFDAEMLQAQQSKFTSEDSTNRSIVMGSPGFRNGKADAYQKLMLLSFRKSFYEADHFNKLTLELPSGFVTSNKALFTGLTPELTQYDYYPELKSLTFPVLIIHGEADAIPLRASTKLRDALPHASLKVFSKSSHFAFIDEPKKFVKEVSGFMH